MMVTAGNQIWALVDRKILLRGPIGWKHVLGPEDHQGLSLRVVELAATVDVESEDGHTFNIFTLYALTEHGMLFVSDRYGRWTRIPAP